MSFISITKTVTKREVILFFGFFAFSRKTDYSLKIFFDDPPPISFRDCLTLSYQEKRHALAIIHHSNSFLSVACVLMELKAISKNEPSLQLIILGNQFNV